MKNDPSFRQEPVKRRGEHRGVEWTVLGYPSYDGRGREFGPQEVGRVDGRITFMFSHENVDFRRLFRAYEPTGLLMDEVQKCCVNEIDKVLDQAERRKEGAA